MWFVWISEQTAIIYYTTLIVTEAGSVYCAVRTGCLYVICCDFNLRKNIGREARKRSIHLSEQPIYKVRKNTHTHTQHIYTHEIIRIIHKHISTDMHFIYLLANSHLILLV